MRAISSVGATPRAAQSQATWVLTSYTITNAIILPLSGWLASTLGRKRYFMGSIGAFSIASRQNPFRMPAMGSAI